MLTEEQVLHELQRVIDPELGLDIVNLGLVYNVEILEDDGSVIVEMTLTTPACPLSQSMSEAVLQVLRSLDGVKRAQCNFVWSPPWDPSMMTPVGRARLGVS